MKLFGYKISIEKIKKEPSLAEKLVKELNCLDWPITKINLIKVYRKVNKEANLTKCKEAIEELFDFSHYDVRIRGQK